MRLEKLKCVRNNSDCNSRIVLSCRPYPENPVSVIWEMIGSQSIDTTIGPSFTFGRRLLTKLINHENPQNMEKPRYRQGWQESCRKYF